MTITWLGIVVIVILLLNGYRGYKRGFVREVVSFFFVFLALAVAWAINPYVNDFFMESTPVYEKIKESCEEFAGGKAEELQADDGEKQKEEQKDFIDGLGLPEPLQRSLNANNTDDVYNYLAVDTFGNYVSSYLARIIVNGLSFLVSYLLASVIIRIGMFLLDLIAGLPLIKEANKLTGGLVGIVKGVLFVWIAFLVLTVLCSTEIGKAGLNLIEKDAFLNGLYEYDIFVNFFMSIFYGG